MEPFLAFVLALFAFALFALFCGDKLPGWACLAIIFVFGFALLDFTIYLGVAMPLVNRQGYGVTTAQQNTIFMWSSAIALTAISWLCYSLHTGRVSRVTTRLSDCKR